MKKQTILLGGLVLLVLILAGCTLGGQGGGPTTTGGGRGDFNATVQKPIPAPDFNVPSISFSHPSGGNATITAQIKNIGTKAYQGTLFHMIDIYDSNNQLLMSSLINRTNHYYAIGGYTTESFTWGPPQNGSYYAKVTADLYNDVRELKENNNIRLLYFTISDMNQGDQNHTECIGLECVTVSGPGTNECNTDSDCNVGLAWFRIVDLGMLGNIGSEAWDLSATDEATGFSFLPPTDCQEPGYPYACEYAHAFFWKEGNLLDIGTLPGDTVSNGFGINDYGKVVGRSSRLDSSPVHAFVWENNRMTGLPNGFGGIYSYAKNINNLGQIVGGARLPSGHERAVMWEDENQMINLGTLPGGNKSYATNINESGKVVGLSNLSSGHEHAFLWVNGVMTDLGNLPDGVFSEATAINNLDVVVGAASVPAGQGLQYKHAFRWENGIMTDLGCLPQTRSCEAYGINDALEIVGTNEQSDAIIWKNGVLYNLNERIPQNSGWSLLGARAINNRGHIAGTGIAPDGIAHGFILIPLDDQNHLACVNLQCVLIPGQGQDLCNNNSDCNADLNHHLACVNQSCVSVPGQGQDLCQTNADCNASLAPDFNVPFMNRIHDGNGHGTLRFTVKNIGTLGYQGPLWHKGTLYRTDANNQVVWMQNFNASYQNYYVGAQYDYNKSYSLPNGWYKYVAFADSNYNVNELNENNNQNLMYFQINDSNSP